MKPTQEQVIAWAREAEAYEDDDPANANERIWVMNDEELQAATTLAYEAGRKDENEACANVCVEDASLMRGGTPPQIALMDAAVAIRARREHG